jgi:RNA polymerase sigma factor (sigma-70 family)
LISASCTATLIKRFFARRCREPEVVADLTAQTFAEALQSAGSFDGRGSVRGWLIAIGRAVYARHCASMVQGEQLVARLSGEFEPSDDQLAEVADRIDAQRRGRELLLAASRLSACDRLVIELVDLMDFSSKEAAQVIGVSAGSVRVRLFRAHARLRKEDHEERKEDHEEL